MLRLAALLVLPVINTAQSVRDTFRDKVTPIPGSIVYCDIFLGFAEHSGVYIGDNRIVQLNKYGEIEAVTPKEFVSGTSSRSIYVSSREAQGSTKSVGLYTIAKRAESMVGRKRSYGFIVENCHQFTTGCMTNEFNNTNNFLWMLKDETRKRIQANTWRQWYGCFD